MLVPSRASPLLDPVHGQDDARQFCYFGHQVRLCLFRTPLGCVLTIPPRTQDSDAFDHQPVRRSPHFFCAGIDVYLCLDTTGTHLPILGVPSRPHPPIRLGTIFYLSYLVFEYPQNLALQKFPVGKWMRYVTPCMSR